MTFFVSNSVVAVVNVIIVTHAEALKDLQEYLKLLKVVVAALIDNSGELQHPSLWVSTDSGWKLVRWTV